MSTTPASQIAPDVYLAQPQQEEAPIVRALKKHLEKYPSCVIAKNVLTEELQAPQKEDL